MQQQQHKNRKHRIALNRTIQIKCLGSNQSNLFLTKFDYNLWIFVIYSPLRVDFKLYMLFCQLYQPEQIALLTFREQIFIFQLMQKLQILKTWKLDYFLLRKIKLYNSLLACLLFWFSSFWWYFFMLQLNVNISIFICSSLNFTVTISFPFLSL